MLERRYAATFVAIFLIGITFASTLCFAAKPADSDTDLVSPRYERPYKMLENKRVDAESGVTLAWYNVNERYSGKSSEFIAREFLRAHKQEIGNLDGFEDFQLVTVKESSGGTHVHMQQVYEGIPVYRAFLNVSMASDKILMAIINPYPGITLTSLVPSFSAEEAHEKTKQALRGAQPDLSDPETELVAYRDQDGDDHLAWHVSFASMNPMGDWEVLWDAHNGELLEVIDRMCYVDGSGHVFNPDPLTTAETTYGGSYSDNNDADCDELNDERFQVDLLDLTQSGDEYELAGPYVELADFESPYTTPVTAADPDAFNFTRSESGFEDVMVYYHIDHAQRHLQELGFDNVQNGPIQCDPHGLDGADNSHYIPATNRLAWGEGGVDDAEDADIIYHEYGHAIQHDQIPNLGGGHSGALGEGFSDYWAGTFSARQSDYHDTWFANWDGHNPYWDGRVLDYAGVYPDDWLGGANIHHDGQIWSSCLWSIRDDIGADIADAVVIQAHFYWAYGTTVEDAAQTLLTADQQLNGGANFTAIAIACYNKGFIDTPPITGVVAGNVWDDFSEEALEGATISIEEGGAVQSDEQGYFIIQNQPIGDWVITISKTGYNDFTDTITVTDGDTTEVFAYLTRPRIVPVPEALSFDINEDDILDTLLVLSNEGIGETMWSLQWRVQDAEQVIPWTLDGDFDIMEASGDTRLTGTAILDGLIAVAGGNGNVNPNKIYFFNAAGDMVAEVDQPTTSFYGFYDLASDGELLYGTEYDWIIGFDTSGEILDSIPAPFDVNRGITYDPDHDWFWCSNGASDMVAVDRDGVIQNEISIDRNIQAVGWYPFDPEGMPLYATTATGGVPRIYRVNPETGDSEIIEDYASTDNGVVIVGADCGTGIEGMENTWVFPVVLIDAGQTIGQLKLYKLGNAVAYADVFPKYGTLDASQADTLALSFDATGLSRGYYYSFLDIIRPGLEDTTTVPVTMYVHSVGTDDTALPSVFSLSSAYPNPFNPSVAWQIELPGQADLSIRVFDILGRQVAQLTYGMLSAGKHQLEWNTHGDLASGIYFARIQSEAYNVNKVERLLLIR